MDYKWARRDTERSVGLQSLDLGAENGNGHTVEESEICLWWRIERI